MINCPEHGADPPIILLTGSGRGPVGDNEPSLHVDRVLSKPPRLRELRTALAELKTAKS